MIISVIIPSRNAANLAPCVAAVRKHEPDARIIVVDDGVSWDNAATKAVLGAEGRVVVTQGVKPFIFARNVNLGFAYADIHHRSDAHLILNDDALLQSPGGFSLLAREAEARPEYGIIASTCNNVGNTNQWPQGVGLRDEPRMVCFVCVLIPRRTLEMVGLLDERYVGYGCDDDDYSFAVRKAGLKIGIHDGCYVDHGSLSSSYRGAAGAGGDFRPNLVRFIEKWGTDNWGRTRETSPFRELFPHERAA